MAILPNYALKQLFENGDLLTQSSLYELIDATYNQTLVAGSSIALNTVTTPSGTTVTINAIGAGTGTVTSVTAGTGISISGTTTVNPTVNITYAGAANAILAATTATPVGADTLWFSDATDSTIKKALISSFPGFGADGTVTSVTAGTGISISGTTTVNPTVNVDYTGTDNVILAATDGTALTILSADRILLSAAVDNTAYYVNVSQLITAVGSTTASNGLTESAGDIKLGGTLTAATSIALDTHDLKFEGIGNVDIGLTYATGTAKTLLETGSDVLGLTALGAPNGVSGIGAMYMEDGADLANSNSAMFIAGNLSDFGFPGTGMVMRVGDFSGNFPEAGISIVTDSVAGAAFVELFAYGFNTDQSEVVVMAEHDADIAYSVTSIGIGGPTGTKELVLSDSGWEILNDVDGDQYKFPWTSGTAGQVLADDGLGNHDLTWVDMGGGLFEENTTGGAQSTQRVGAGTASGYYSTISGGYINTASGDYSTIGGGIYNTSSGPASTVGGGGGNTASGYYSTIGGGIYNIASDNISTVGGGYNNTASGYYSTVSGGFQNTASYNNSTVGGGGNNTASNYASTVGGGIYNTSSGPGSTVGGGGGNTASNDTSTVGGGYSNIASGYYSTVGGGYNNTASYIASTIGGGYYNTASAAYSTIGGGFGNISSNNYSTISGGRINTASAAYSTIGGGNVNISSNNYSTISGGRINTASGYYSTIGGGNVNIATGNSSTVGGGNINVASADNSSVLGGQNNNTSTFANSHIIGSNITSDRANTTFIESLSIKSIPLSAAGLPSGSVWSNSGVLNIV